MVLVFCCALGFGAGIGCESKPAGETETAKSASAPESGAEQEGGAGEAGAQGEGAAVQPGPPTEIATPEGLITVTPLAHASFVLTWGEWVLVVDPVADAVAAAGGFEAIAPPDVILVTDIHFDHLDPKTIASLRAEKTIVVAPESASSDIPDVKVVANGDMLDLLDDALEVTAVPMYNITRKNPESGEPFHVPGRGNGYLLTRGETTVYISGDTECIAEMKALERVEVAFVCMNLPYTMPIEEAAECVKAFMPRVVFPYHYRGQDPAAFAALLEGLKEVDVRVLDWYPASERPTGDK